MSIDPTGSNEGSSSQAEGPPESENIAHEPGATSAAVGDQDDVPDAKRRRLDSAPFDQKVLSIPPPPPSESRAPQAIAAIISSDAQPVQEFSKSDSEQHAQPAESVPQLQHRQPLSHLDKEIKSPSHKESFSVLDQHANTLLLFLASMTSVEIGEMLFGPPSARTQEYKTFRSRLEQVKTKLSPSSSFLSPEQLSLTDQTQIDILRKANLATFISGVFGGDLGMRIMDITFIETFVPLGGSLSTAQGSIYLALKTQAFVAARRMPSVSPYQIMRDLFPPNVEDQLLARRPKSRVLTVQEREFLQQFNIRKDSLYADIKNNRLDDLHERYRWDSYSREVSLYLTQNCNAIISSGKASHLDEHWQPGSSQIPLATVTTTSGRSKLPPVTTNEAGGDDFIAQAARAAQIALQGAGFGIPGQVVPTMAQSVPSQAVITGVQRSTLGKSPGVLSKEPTQSAPAIQMRTPQQGARPTASPIPEPARKSMAPVKTPHSSQTAPTEVLFERARVVSDENDPLAPSKIAVSTSRRPWTQEEENALMTGLDTVKGPYWSQILAMYGPGGSINESLKERNQVQLKDKARNLKLFFLKAGIEVPYYLQHVTGELRTRAPGQAERLEAKERENTTGDDSRSQTADVFDEGPEGDTGTNCDVNMSELAADIGQSHPPIPDFLPSTGLGLQSTQDVPADMPLEFDFAAMAASAAADVERELARGT